MKVGFITYCDMTEIEFICVHECLSKVHQLGFPKPPECHVIGVQREVLGWNGIVIKPHHYFAEIGVNDFDLMVVPGGWASRRTRYNAAFVQWLRGWDTHKTIASCCSGSLILGEAGFLKGKRATAHSLAFGNLKPYCAEVVAQRVVEDGNVITAGGLMAAFDLGLHLVAKFWGADARRAIAHQDEYRDVQVDPLTVPLLPKLDTWYAGGHIDSNKRPADWFAPPPDQ